MPGCGQVFGARRWGGGWGEGDFPAHLSPAAQGHVSDLSIEEDPGLREGRGGLRNHIMDAPPSGLTVQQH